jgi:hypothetical protein
MKILQLHRQNRTYSDESLPRASSFGGVLIQHVLIQPKRMQNTRERMERKEVSCGHTATVNATVAILNCISMTTPALTASCAPLTTAG